jgi:putative tryptophan/tyrosine transport system substrate-binding protein
MNRRELLLLMGSTTIARQAADDDAAMRRIVPIAGEGGRSWPNWVAFADELGQAGYTDGHNIAIDYIFRSVTLSPPALTQAIDAELGRGAEVIIAYGPERTLAAAVAATHTIPIVMVDYDPLAKGYIAGLARPGGNITGVFLQQIEQSAKRLDLFKQAVPDMRRVALLWDRISADQYEAARKARRQWALPPSRSSSTTPLMTTSARSVRRESGRATGCW